VKRFSFLTVTFVACIMTAFPYALRGYGILITYSLGVVTGLAIACLLRLYGNLLKRRKLKAEAAQPAPAAPAPAWHYNAAADVAELRAALHATWYEAGSVGVTPAAAVAMLDRMTAPHARARNLAELRAMANALTDPAPVHWTVEVLTAAGAGGPAPAVERTGRRRRWLQAV
jgi:hypothetical protein